MFSVSCGIYLVGAVRKAYSVTEYEIGQHIGKYLAQVGDRDGGRRQRCARALQHAAPQPAGPQPAAPQHAGPQPAGSPSQDAD